MIGFAVGKKVPKFLSVDLPPRHDERIERLRQIAGNLPFHERYVSGDFAGVWADLCGLSEELRYDPVAVDALAVAYETMHRAARNIAILVARLETIGYEFRGDVFSPYWKTSIADAATREAVEGRLDELVEEWLATEVPKDMAPHLIAWSEQNRRRAEAELHARREARMGIVRPHLPPEPAVDFRLKRIEKLAGEMPLSLRAWYQTVGAVNLVGSHRELVPHGVECDPLFVAPLQFVLDFGLAWDEDYAGDEARPRFQLPISPHRIAKASGTTGQRAHRSTP
jgi:hypothetical protein